MTLEYWEQLKKVEKTKRHRVIKDKMLLMGQARMENYLSNLSTWKSLMPLENMVLMSQLGQKPAWSVERIGSEDVEIA